MGNILDQLKARNCTCKTAAKIDCSSCTSSVNKEFYNISIDATTTLGNFCIAVSSCVDAQLEKFGNSSLNDIPHFTSASTAFLKAISGYTSSDLVLSTSGGVISWDTVSGGSGTVTGADQGLSVVSNVVKLGQTVGQSGSPADFSTDREIDLKHHSLFLRGANFVIENDKGNGATIDQYPLVVRNTIANSVRTARFEAEFNEIEIVTTKASGGFASLNWYDKTVYKATIGYDGPFNKIFMIDLRNGTGATWEINGSGMGGIINNTTAAASNFFFGAAGADSGHKVQVNGSIKVSGATNLTGLANDTDQDRLLGLKLSTGKVGLLTLGAGLTLSSGVLNTAAISIPINSLLQATATNTIDNQNFVQNWQWNSYTLAGLGITSTSTVALDFSSLFAVITSGANATSSITTSAATFVNSRSGTGSTSIGASASASGNINNIAVDAVASGGSTTNIAVRATGNIDAMNGVHIKGSLSNYVGNGLEMEWNGSNAVLRAYNRTGGSGNNMQIAANTLSIQVGAAVSLQAFKIDTNGNVSVGTNLSPNSSLHVSGSLAVGLVSKAVSYAPDITDSVIKVTATGQTITLPTAVGIPGRIYTIKLTASGSCTVATTSSQNIDASTTYSLSAQYKYVSVVSDGANWLIIANN